MKSEKYNARMLTRQEDSFVKELSLTVVSDNEDSAVIRIIGKIDIQSVVEKSKKIY